MPPGEAKSLLELMGNMNPSESALARLPRKFNEQWEQHREPFECILRESIKLPEEAITVAVSLDGVMLPMKDGKRQEKREQNKASGKRTRGPAGCQEASCGTLSFYGAGGERLSTIRMGRMPESTSQYETFTLTENGAKFKEHLSGWQVRIWDNRKKNHVNKSCKTKAEADAWGTGAKDSVSFAAETAIRLRELCNAGRYQIVYTVIN